MSASLVVDLGGTYTRFAIMNKEYQISCKESFINNQFHTFSDVFNKYLTLHSKQLANANQCCIAVAGPVKNNQAQLTNINWFLDKDTLLSHMPFSRIELINDFHSLGFSIPLLKNECTTTLQQGTPNSNALKVILGAGTGLGIALIKHDKDNVQVFPSEGGHIDFAPTNKQEEKLLNFLKKKYNHISVEHILSGHGLEHIFEFIYQEENSSYKDVCLNSKDYTCNDITGSKVIKLATEDKHPIAITAVKLFCEVYAAYIGNIALMTIPYGGIYITGGIARHILPFLQDPNFLATYRAKGRLSSLLDHVPIHYIINKNANLLGAGFYLKKNSI